MAVDSVKNLFAVAELRKRVLFTLGLLIVYRIGGHIPTPGVNSAAIILQLLTVVWPYLERLSKEGELGRRKSTQYTRYGTILLSVVQALGIAYFLEKNTGIAGGLPLDRK